MTKTQVKINKNFLPLIFNICFGFLDLKSHVKCYDKQNLAL